MTFLQQIILIFLTFFPAFPAFSGSDHALQAGHSGRVSQVVDGDTLLLDNGEEIRLVGIQAPKLPLGRKYFEQWPLAEEAKTLLEELTLDRQVRLSFGGARGDRHGRTLAHLHLLDDKGEAGLWVQAELLRQGMARVYSFPDNRARVQDLLAVEAEAREARRGIWSHEFYALRHHSRTFPHIGSFQLVEGKVHNVARVRGRIYLNFEENWRKDFTIVIDPKYRRQFEKAGIDEQFYAGKYVRIRGWISHYNGPMIKATHPEQIEVLTQ